MTILMYYNYQPRNIQLTQFDIKTFNKIYMHFYEDVKQDGGSTMDK